MDHYEAFRCVLDTHPTGAPPSQAFDELVRLIFTEDEIRIALGMSFRLKTVEEIIQTVSFAKEEAMIHLDTLAEKGAIFCHVAKKESDMP